MRKKTISIRHRLGALALVLVMVFAMLLSGVTAKADSTIDEDAKGCLTIYKYEGEEGDTSTPLEGVTFSYLKVGDVAQYTNESGNVTIGYSITDTNLTTSGTDYYLDVSSLTPVFVSDEVNYYAPSDLDTLLDGLSQNSLETFMSISTGVGTMTTDSSGYASSGSDQEEDTLDVGLYLVVETGYPPTVTSTSQPFFVSIPMTEIEQVNEEEEEGGSDTTYYWNYHVTAYPKNLTRPVDIEKSVVEDGNESSVIDGEIGQVKEFVIRADVPGAIGNMSDYFITDTLSEGLDFQEVIAVRGVRIEADAEGNESIVYDTLDSDTDYTFQQTENDDGTTTLTFDFTTTSLGDRSNQKYVQIEITYHASLNENAVVGDPGNKNEAELVYSETTGTGSGLIDPIPAESPYVYTYAVSLLKYGNGDDENNKLSGVEFALYRANDSENPDYENSTKLMVIQSEEGSYYYVYGEDSGNTGEPITTSSNGTIDLRGLETGTYYLVETKTVDDYNLLANPIEIIISSTESDYEVNSSGTYAPVTAGETYYADSNQEIPFILPEDVEDLTEGEYIYVNFGTSEVYDSDGDQVQMYSPAALQWTVTVGGTTVISGDESANTDIGEGEISISVNNSSGFQLPSTGGSGIYLIIIIGAVLVIVAAVILTRSLRRR